MWSKETDRRITKLIRPTFETGALFSVMAFLDLAAYLHMSYLHVSMYDVYCALDSSAVPNLASLADRWCYPSCTATHSWRRSTHASVYMSVLRQNRGERAARHQGAATRPSSHLLVFL